MRLPVIARPSACAVMVVLCMWMGWWAAPPVNAQTFASQQQSVEGDRLLRAGIEAYRQSMFSDAAHLWEQARVVYERELGRAHRDTLNTMVNLAGAYRVLGQDTRALPLQEQIWQLRRVQLGNDHLETLSAMSNVAATYSALGQQDRGHALSEQALLLTQAKLGNNHPHTLAARLRLIPYYQTSGAHEQAAALGEQILSQLTALHGEAHPVALEAMNGLADTYSTLGQYDKTRVLHERLLQLRRSKLGEEHQDTLDAMIRLAGTYGALRELDRALDLNRQVLQISRAQLGRDHARTLGAMTQLANFYSFLGQHDQAQALCEEVLALRRTQRFPHERDILGDMQTLAAVYGGSPGQQSKAIALIPAISSSIEKLRTVPGLSTQQQQGVFAWYSDDYQNYAHWYAVAQHLPEAFNLGDLSKARTLTDSIKAQSALRALPDVEQTRLLSSEVRGRFLAEQLDKLANAGGTTEALLAAQQAIEAHNTQHAQLLTELQQRFPRYAQLTTLAPATAQDAPRLLSAGDAFVSYLIRTNGFAQAFVLSPDAKVQWVELGQIANHAQSVAAYRELISPKDSKHLEGHLVTLKGGGYAWIAAGSAAPQGASVVADNRETALALLRDYWHKTLIAPVLPLAGTATRWIISPDKDLALLPFDTLPVSEASTLGQTRQLTLVQSFAVYALLKQREAQYANLPRAKALFAMGNAVYDEGWAEGRGMQRGGVRGFRDGRGIDPGVPTEAFDQALKPAAEQYTVQQLHWLNLRGSAQELKTVSTVFAGQNDTYQGLDASEGKLQSLNQAGKLQDYRYLLFSAHGYLAQNPALSALVLSQKGNPEGIDGYVTASEWPLYDLKSDLTVLSACDTGVGQTQAGESVMGLPYALFVAGNKNTILTLWPVDDDATAEFMRRFFTKLKAGTPQAQALSQTKREFMNSGGVWSQPKYWAAFVLYGV